MQLTVKIIIKISFPFSLIEVVTDKPKEKVVVSPARAVRIAPTIVVAAFIGWRAVLVTKTPAMTIDVPKI